jgi:hypothetical protein
MVGSGTGAITPIVVGTNGQVLLGSSAADPVFGTLTSSDSTIEFTTGAGSLSIQGAAATATQAGVIEMATDAETNTGTAIDRALTPANITAWTGDTALVTVGTIATGTWNATAVAEIYGGTAQTTYATGDILYASSSNTLSKLAAGSDTEVLTLASGVPSWAAGGSGTVTSVSGTSNRISSSGGTTPVIDIDAAYVGQASITTLGTITTGVWNGTDVAAADGGTGRSSHTAYAVICGGTTSTAAQQSIASVGTSGQVLTSNGAAALPTFQAVSGGVQVLTVTALDNTDSTYTVLVTDYYMSCNTTSGVLIVDLPNAPATGTAYVVKDAAGTADTNTITISTAGAETIDGAATFVMNTEYQSANFVYTGAAWEIF